MVELTVLSPLAAWGNFYVIAGSAAAALTGLQFVVIALVAELKTPGMAQIRAFATPTIVHFCAVLLVSTILSAPWTSFSSAGISLGSCGAVGVVYAVMIILRTRRQTGYKPVLEDWLWHCMLPLMAYSALVVGAIVLARYAGPSLFTVGAAVILLLFIGIHNAWDTVIYLLVERGSARKDADNSQS